MKKILYKKLEKRIFTLSDTETIVSYYGFFSDHFLERFEIEDSNILEEIKYELLGATRKAVSLYKENKNYEKDYSFFTYCTYFFAEIINKHIESYPSKVVKLEVLELEEFDWFIMKRLAIL